MNIYILNKNFESIYLVSSFQSFLWIDRYFKAGEFELYIPPEDGILDYFVFGNYVWFSESPHLMIIDYVEKDTNAEDGDMLIIKGKSLEWILSRRIVWTQTILNTNLQNGIKKLLNDSIINPSLSERKISNFIFKDTTDPTILSIKMDIQYTGDNIYDSIQYICEENGIGFKILLNDNNQFVFELYCGKNRSCDQIALPQVIFSKLYSNIDESEYVENRSDFKNVTLIGGEGEGSERRFAILGNTTGLDRREIFTNAAHVRSETDDGTIIPTSQYIAMLKEEGLKTLIENKIQLAFDGSVDYQRPFLYGEDYFLGDTVQVEDDFGLSGKFRIIEFMWSYTDSEVTCYPTFESLFNKGE